MSTSKLKLNPDKTEFILFDSKKQEKKLKAWFPIDILGSPLCPAESFKNLGVWFDCDFSMSKHVESVCKSCFIQLLDFSHISSFLLMIHPYLWPMLLSVVGWIIIILFSEVSPSSIST